MWWGWSGRGRGWGRGWCWRYYPQIPTPEYVKPELEEKARRIYELLPKLDCGRCGYSGCYEMAIAIAEGRERADACRVAGKRIAPLIEEVLGRKEVSIDVDDRVRALEEKIKRLEDELRDIKEMLKEIRDRL